MKYLMLILSVAIFASCSDVQPTTAKRPQREKGIGLRTPSSDTVLPKDVSFQIIDEQFQGVDKLSVDVRISRKLTDDELKTLSIKLREGRDYYNKLYLAYYLDGMTVGSGAWAVASYNPYLKVESPGIGIDPFQVKGKTIGLWDLTSHHYKFLLYERNDSLFMRDIILIPATKEEVIDWPVKKVKTYDGTAYIPISDDYFEYHIVLKNGDLGCYNEKKEQWAVAKKIK